MSKLDRTKFLAVAGLLLVTLAGCGDDDSDDRSSNDRESSGAPSSSAPAALTVADVCPQIETGLPEDALRIGGEQEAGAYADELRTMSDQGDDQVKDVLDDLIEALDDIEALEGDGRDPKVVDGDVVMPGSEASEDFDEAVRDLREACSAAGTPIFQE